MSSSFAGVTVAARPEHHREPSLRPAQSLQHGLKGAGFVGVVDDGEEVVIDGHGAYFAAIKATYDSLREQRQIFTQASDLSATELTHTYTQPEEYIRYAEEFMSVKE